MASINGGAAIHRRNECGFNFTETYRHYFTSQGRILYFSTTKHLLVVLLQCNFDVTRHVVTQLNLPANHPNNHQQSTLPPTPRANKCTPPAAFAPKLPHHNTATRLDSPKLSSTPPRPRTIPPHLITTTSHHYHYNRMSYATTPKCPTPPSSKKCAKAT